MSHPELLTRMSIFVSGRSVERNHFEMEVMTFSAEEGLRRSARTEKARGL